MTEVSLQTLLDTGAHFGHQIRRWNPKMKPFIYQGEDGVHIFDLLKTKEALEEALGIIKEAAKEGKSLLIVGTKKQVREKVAQIAKETNILYVNERWLGGTLTNFDQMKKSTRKLTELKDGLSGNTFRDRTKKERLLIERE